MTDIVERLLDRAYSFKAKDPLCEEAAKEIERLRRKLASIERFAETGNMFEAMFGTPVSRAGQRGTKTQNSDVNCPERDNTTHDAAPAARATADRYVRRAAADGDSDRTDKAAPRPSEGTGETLSKAEIDALQHVVEDGKLVDLADYGRLRSLLVRLRPEWEDPNDPAEVPHAQPRNGAMSDILQDARNWLASLPERIGTHWPECHTDRHHAPCLVRKLADEIARLREAIRRLADQDATLSMQGGSVTVTMDATLTKEEREAVRFFSLIDGPGNVPVANKKAATLRGLLERMP